VSQTVIPEICPRSRIIGLVTLSAVTGVAVLATWDNIRWAAVIVAIVVTIVSVVIVSVVTAVAVSESTASSQPSDKP
jgi:hypothetical protein